MGKIIIIGAGASGLFCGWKLAAAGKEVLILEAADRIGGRIFTDEKNFTRRIERGAEFIHGDAEITLDLLKQAKLHHYPTEGKVWQEKSGKVEASWNFIEDESKLNRHLEELDKEMSVDDFLQKYFDPEKDHDVIRSIKKFVEGYDAAHSDRASALTFRDEWFEMSESEQYHIAEGYQALMNFLKEKLIEHGGELKLNEKVVEVNYSEQEIKVFTKNDIFNCDKLIVSVSAGVMANEKINFIPKPEKIINAYKEIGFGHVIKFLFEFDYPFWDHSNGVDLKIKQTKDLGFLFSDQDVPTWWTALPDKYPLLTGWLAGPNAEKLYLKSNDELREIGIKSLAGVYNIPTELLKKISIHSAVINWSKDDLFCGAYSYSYVNKKEIIQPILNGIENRIYFVGEAVSNGKDVGTVESAFYSAAELLKKLK